MLHDPIIQVDLNLPTIMDRYFVFRHSLVAISDLIYYTVDDIFQGINHNSIEHDLIGSSCLFKLDQSQDGLNIGYLSMDEDINPVSIPEIEYSQKVKFPTAEYLYNLHRGPFTKIGETYKKIEETLSKEGLNPIFHPILVFPKRIPRTIYDDTLIEIWTGTNADIQAEYRRSEEIKEALPRTSFNFYTW